MPIVQTNNRRLFQNHLLFCLSGALRFAAAILLLAAASRQALSAELNINFAPCGFNFGEWCVFTYDTGEIDAVYHIGPGTPDGWYPVNFVTHLGYPYAGFSANVTNGVGSPVTIATARAIDLSPSDGVQLVTTDGSAASLTRHDTYLGQLGQPYPSQIPDGQHKVVTLDVYINSPAPTPPPVDQNQTKLNDPNTDCFGVGSSGSPMARYWIHLLLASLHIEDTPISYVPPRGPKLNFQVIYNQREGNQPPTFNFSNLGPKWTFNWLSYVTDDPSNPATGATVYVRGGGSEAYSGWNDGSQSYAPDAQSMAVLVKTSPTGYERRLPDGSKEVFSVVSGSSYPRRLFMSKFIDAAANAVTLTYDSTLRLTKITDSLGQITKLAYALTGDSLKITKVTDPFGRAATFTYTAGQLTKVTDPVGFQSRFAYNTGSDFINAMTTPYGTTTFAKGENGDSLRWLEATDPLGGKERVEYNDLAPNIRPVEGNAPAGVFNAGLHRANTFHWNKKAMADAPGDYSKAHMIHWLASADGTKVSGIKHSEKEALENRVWYLYSGQTDASKQGPTGLLSRILRLLDDSSTQLQQFEYNSLGNITKETDPAGRVISYTYAANGIDALQKRQTRGSNNELLAKFTYNNKHLPLTSTDAAGEKTIYTYNSFGQLKTITNPKNEVTTFNYDRDQNSDGVSDGYLLSVVGPIVGATTTYAYDTAKRIQSITDSDGYAHTFGYDNIDRLTSVTYPDTTNTQFKFTKYVNGTDTGTMLLDLGASKDHRGRWTYREYNANRQLTKVTDPLGRKTIFDWCTCGALSAITDGNNHVTNFIRDVQGRITSKTFADTKSIIYAYENTTSRLKSVTDAKSQVATSNYNIDDTISQISYAQANGQPLFPATPSVSFTYDPNYRRVVTMTDGIGTTTYTHYPITGSVLLGAGQLHLIDGPLANDTITYTYDELGRELSAAVNGVTASQSYDSLGRVATVTNPLGQFTNTYVANSPRLQSTAYPNGQSAVYSYFDNIGDKRLQTLQNKNSAGGNISKFDYTYDADGEILSWTRQFDASNPIQWANGNNPMADLADQVTSVIEKDTITQALRASYSYGYDNAGNRTSDNSASYSINTVNQITNSGYTYDNNENLTSDIGRTFEWDGADRLVAINYTALNSRTEFAFDGLGRRVKIVEKNPALSGIIQPTDTQYGSYNVGPVTLPAGTYNLTFQGLNANGGDNTAFVDLVTLNGALVSNGGFETPNVGGGIASQPAGATWTFVTSSAGITGNNNGFTSGNPNAPEGLQVAYLQMNAAISQSISLTAGSYALSFQAAQRGNGNSSNQQLQVSLQPPNPIATTKQFVWVGNQVAEERDANNNVTKRFYRQGVQLTQPTTLNLYYSRDHLGSVRELTDSIGAVRARYDYDPYGNRTKVSGDLDADFGFTGYYYHQASGLNLAPYRGYDPAVGRWLNRDPIGEAGGNNLYSYVLNNPVLLVDPFGLDAILTLQGVYLGNAVNSSEFGGGRERGHMPSAYGPFQVNADNPEAALPFRLPQDQRQVDVYNSQNNRQTHCNVTDVGPWNTRDPYWRDGSRPMAESQYANGTQAQNGQVPTNNAGIDLTPAAMNNLGFRGPENTRQGPVLWHSSNEPFSGYFPFFGP